MSLALFTEVILQVDLPEEGLAADDVGVVVERHEVTGRETGYSVEFFDMLGNTAAVVTVPANSLRRPTAADRPVVRQSAEYDIIISQSVEREPRERLSDEQLAALYAEAAEEDRLLAQLGLARYAEILRDEEEDESV